MPLYGWRCPVHQTIGPDPGVGWRDGEVRCYRGHPENPQRYCLAICRRVELAPVGLSEKREDVD
jgi:hypothetical protein